MIFRPYFVVCFYMFRSIFFLEVSTLSSYGFGVLFRFLFYFIGFTLEYALRVDMRCPRSFYILYLGDSYEGFQVITSNAYATSYFQVQITVVVYSCFYLIVEKGAVFYLCRTLLALT